MLDRNLTAAFPPATPRAFSSPLSHLLGTVVRHPDRLESLAADLEHDPKLVAQVIAGAAHVRPPGADDVLNTAHDLADIARNLASRCAAMYSERTYPHTGDLALERQRLGDVIDALELARTVLLRCSEAANP